MRDLANGQLEEVKRLQDLATMAWNTAKEAKKTLTEARQKQNDTMKQMDIVDNLLEDSQKLGQVALANATTAKQEAEKTFRNAQYFESMAKQPLRNVDSNETKGTKLYLL